MTSITQERTGLKAKGMVHRSREQAGFRGDYTGARSVIEPATRVFVHISVTNPENYSSDDRHARAIEAIGLARFPSTGVSYNRLLMRSGAHYEGQPVGRRGAHTVNDDQRATCGTSGCPSRGGSVSAPSFNLNYNARAYVICQNVQHSVTAAQLDSLARAIAADQLVGFVTRGAPIHGHRCVSSKDCPGGAMWALMGQLEQKVNHYLSVGLGAPPTDWLTMASKEDVKAAVREVLAERELTLDWDGSKRSIYEVLSFIHFNAADGSFVGQIPATTRRTNHAGRNTHAADVNLELDAITGAHTTTGEGDSTPPS